MPVYSGGISSVWDSHEKVAVDPVSIHDIHATVLHCLGMDHKRVTYFHNGRNFPLTDLAGEILRPILA